MAPEKVTEMVLNVDLKCSGCYKKVKKVINKTPQIRDQVFDVEKNKVKIMVVCCSPENIRDKLCYKGGGAIQSIEIIEKPKEPVEKPKVAVEKPKEPAAADKLKEPAKPASDKPKEPAKPAADKPKELAKPADRPKEPAKQAVDKLKEPAKPADDKPKEPEKPKPAVEKPKEPEKVKPAVDKPKEPEKAKSAADKPNEPEKPKPADKPKDSGKPPEPEKAKPKDAEKPKEVVKPPPSKEVPVQMVAGPNPEVAKMVYEPVHGYPHMYPILSANYPMVGYGQHYDHYYGGTPFEHGYGTPLAPLLPPSYGGFEYGHDDYNRYNENMTHYASNDYGGEEDGEGCSIM